MSRRPAALLVPLLCAAPAQAQEGPPFALRSLLPDLLELRPGLLRGLEVDFKTFATADGEDSFGFRYEYERTFQPGDGWLAIRPRVVGNVAFDPAVNPEDFLAARLDLTWQHSGGGLTRAALDDEEFAAWQAAQRAAADIEDEEDLERFLQDTRVTALFGPQLTVDLGLSGGFESNQAFTARQATFGAVATLDLDLWGDAARFNLFDYPFALLRHLVDERRHPTVAALGSTFPSVLLGLDRVVPIEGDPRAAVGDDGDYWRLHLEVGMRSPIARIGEETLFVNGSYRLFHEFGASAAVRQADLDLFQYGVASITTSSGLFVRYVSGTLPLDRAADTAFELGWSYRF